MSNSQLEGIPTLLAKLHKAAKAINYIEKGGYNSHHNYSFVQAADVVQKVRDLLLEEGVMLMPGASNARHEPNGKGTLTTVDLMYRFVDIVTGAAVEVPWVGTGQDTGGDKGIYKAYTGGLKYALLNLFMIPTGDDPEEDRQTDAGSSKAHKDDQRPQAPRIPVDRAQAILTKAVGVAMAWFAEDGTTPVIHPVLQAFLQQQGVAKIGLLNVDQAEAVEAFLANEAKS